jgi:hypothetical protein
MLQLTQVAYVELGSEIPNAHAMQTRQRSQLSPATSPLPIRAVFPSRISDTALSALEALLSHRQGCSAFGALDSSRHRALVTFL